MSGGKVLESGLREVIFENGDNGENELMKSFIKEDLISSGNIPRMVCFTDRSMSVATGTPLTIGRSVS